MKYLIRKSHFIVFAFILTAIFLASCGRSFEGKLKAYSHGMNSECPVMVDELTQLDETMVVDTKVLRLNYTIMQGLPTSDTIALKKGMKDINLQMLKSEQNKFVTDNEVVVQYYYYDTLKNYLFSVEIKPEEYK